MAGTRPHAAISPGSSVKVPTFSNIANELQLVWPGAGFGSQVTRIF
jgi:hypothetical protein